MELVYLWVENYKNIHEQGFNFSSRFNCDYNKKTNKLTIKENDDYIPDFFGKNINVTAIVGKNGSGKSSVLEILLKIYNLGYIKNNDYTFLLYLKKDTFYISNNYYRHCENKHEISFDKILNIKNNFPKSNYELHIYDNCISEVDSKIISSQIVSTDEPKVPLPLHNGLDINNINNYKIFDEDISFQQKYIQLIDKISFPAEFTFDIYYYYFDIKNLNSYFSIGDEIVDDFDDRKLRIDYIEHKNDFFYRFIALVIYLQAQKEIKNNENLNSYEDRLQLYNNVLKYFENDITFDILKVIFMICQRKTNQKDGFYIIEKDITEFVNLFVTEDDKVFKTDKFSIEKFSKIENKIFSLFENEKIIKINFFNSYSENYSLKNLSSGEYLYLRLRVNYNYSMLNAKSKDIVVLLDEIELSFHPSWQKKIISYLNENIISKNIHLILTTHSPFLLSDIPKQNIIFLDKEENGNCKVLNNNEVLAKEQTFGANIHTLLSDSFFMEDGLMGEFAKGKINEIKRFYEEVIKEDKKEVSNFSSLEKKYKNNKTKFEQIQSIIGEPFLKTVIKNYLDEVENILFDDAKAKKMAIKRFIDEFGEDSVSEVLNGKA